MANSAFYSKQEAKGRVKEACKGFLLKADEQFASKLQDEEFHMHYDKNRKTNQDMRVDVSTVKSIENSEYQDLLMRHQMLEKLEKEDALIAMQMQNEFMSYHDNPEPNNNQVLTDEQLAKKLQEHELLYEEYTDRKPNSQTKQSSSTSNNNQYESLVGDMNLLNLTNKSSQKKKANHRDSINFERANEYGLFEDETRDDDFELAKYLQEEERLEKEVQKLNHKTDQTTNDLIDLSEANTSNSVQNTRSSRSTSSNSSSSFSSLTNWSPIIYKEPENYKINKHDQFESEGEDIGESSLLFSTTPPHNEIDFKGFVAKNRSPKSKNSKKSIFEMSFNFENNKHSDESFEEENLIEETEKFEKDLAKSDFLIKGKSKCNIVETIDPTFKLKKMNSQSKFIQDIKTSYSSKAPLSNLKYEACDDNDTDSFLPVQGQKRSNCKLINKKKKSQTQCLQQ